MGSILCVISGGMDSATLLYKAIAEGESGVDAVSFNYGQRHKKELDYASELCRRLGVRHDVIDVSTLTPYIGGSSLTDDIDVPDGHYTEDSMRITVVPNRNAIMLSIAFGIAVARDASAVGAGMHAGDHAIYPDCRPEFVEAFDKMQKVAVQGHGNPSLYLWTPFINYSKADIAAEGSSLGVDYALTWSCYKGQQFHCGKCGTCYERREAFSLAGVEDPTEYEV
jgi:7-cyano-7-deazaguanine synthase